MKILSGGPYRVTPSGLCGHIRFRRAIIVLPLRGWLFPLYTSPPSLLLQERGEQHSASKDEKQKIALVCKLHLIGAS